MMQDFSSTFDGKQMVRVRPIRMNANRSVNKMVGVILTGIMLVGFSACVFFGMQIRSGLMELSYQESSKLELLKVKQDLYAQRDSLLAQKEIERAAGVLGLYAPSDSQIRRL